MFSRFIITVMFIIFTAPAISAEPSQVGFQRLTTANGLEAGIWYPASGTPIQQRLGLYMHDVVVGAPVTGGDYPLVVISHGTGGDFTGHVDTAVALASAGFIVAALTHSGDNWRDQSRVTQIHERPAALSSLISYMLTTWPGHDAIDPRRIGAFGFSAGGFTVLVAAGGKPKMSRISDHCAAHPRFYVCTLPQSQPPGAAAAWPDLYDPRIKAIVIAAPALGFVFDRAGLADVHVPVQLWRANNDRILPAPFYADAIRSALPVPPEFHAVGGADHFEFLTPCADPAAMPQICRSPAGFDRALFHQSFNANVVRFFKGKLRQH